MIASALRNAIRALRAPGGEPNREPARVTLSPSVFHPPGAIRLISPAEYALARAAADAQAPAGAERG